MVFRIIERILKSRLINSSSAADIILSKNYWSLLSLCSSCLWNQLPIFLRKPHSGTSSSISGSPIPSPINRQTDRHEVIRGDLLDPDDKRNSINRQQQHQQQSNSQTDRQTDSQTDRQTDRQTDMRSYVESCWIQMTNETVLTASSSISSRVTVRLTWHAFHTDASSDLLAAAEI